MNLVSNILQSRTRSIVLLSIIYLLISTYLFSKYGIKVVNDSPRYLNYARSLQEGFYYDPLNFWYFTYVIFIYIHQFFSESLFPIILSQYLLGYLAVLAFYRATEILTKSKLTAFLASFLFILFPDNIFWHSYILTESIYGSFLCCWFYALMLHLRLGKNWSVVLFILTTLICFFSKPTSPALIIAFLSPMIIKFLTDPSYRILKLCGSVVACISVILLANQMISMHEVMLIYKKGDIIFAMHELPSHPFHDLLTVTPPPDMYLPDQGGILLFNMLEFIVHNPIYWAKLFTGKLVMYLTHIRPYWSWAHNVSVLLLVWPSYYFAIMTIKKRRIAKPFIIAYLTYFSVNALIISNTWADWDSRFFVPLFPLLALLGAIGLSDKIEQFKRASH